MDEFLRLQSNQKDEALHVSVRKKESIRSGADSVGVSNSFKLGNITGSHFDNKCFKDTIEKT